MLFILQGCSSVFEAEPENNPEAIFENFWRSKASRRVDTLHAINVVADHTHLGRVDPRAASEMLESLGNRQTIDEFLAAGSVIWTNSVRVIADPPEKALGRRRKQWLSRTIMPVIRSASRTAETSAW